ncbi:MAG: hypothetical protein HDT13_06490 [Butyrivibrio sp.]|nr:hypothetical protein [Butyrivibrio sp.]
MKKRFKLWVAYMLILCMSMAVMLPNSKPVKAEDGDGKLIIDNFYVYINDRDKLKAGDELRDGDQLRVGIEWSLDNSDHASQTFSTVIEDYSNIGFKNQVVDLLLGKNNVVGSLEIQVDDSGNVTLSASFDENFLKSENRRGGGFIFAYADVNMGTGEDGNKQEISIGEDKFPFIYRNNGQNRSSLWVWKSAQGEMESDENGNNKQDFYVSLQVNGGAVTDVKLQDDPGSGLEKLSDPIEITIEESTVDGINVGDKMSLRELEAKLTSMPEDAKIGFKYTVGVKGDVYSESAAQNGDYSNIFKAEYTNNESEPQHAEASANVNVSRPYVSKNGEIVKDDAGNPIKINWTVNITLNDLAGKSVDINIENIIENIIDDYLDKNGDYDLKEIKNNDNVTTGYKLTYSTDISEEKRNSLSDTIYDNEVIVKINGNDYSDKASVILPAKSWIWKYFENYDAENKRLSWKIVCEVPQNAENITGVSLSDWQLWSGEAHHSVIRNSFFIEVDGKKEQVPEYDKSGTQDFYLDRYNDGVVCFSDGYFGRLKGTTLTVYVDTQITDDSVDGNTYINKAQLQYSLNGTVTTLEALAEWNYDSAIIKTGAPDSSATAIDYSVEIDLSKLEELSKRDFKAGIPIIITDTLPEGLTLDKDSCEVIGKAVYNEWGSEWADEDLTKASTVKVDVNGRVIRFEIPVTDTMVNRIKAIKDNDTGVQKVALALKYTAGISDVRKYLADGVELTFTNIASAEYGGENIGDSTNVTKLTPNKLIEKHKDYSAETAPDINYIIEVNPDGFDLSDGSLTVTDTMGEKLIYCLDTILVQKYEGDNLVPLVNGKDYTYVYSRKDNSVVFTLPDSESLVIYYEAYVNADIDMNIESNDELNEQNSFNRVSISGYSNGNGSDNVYFSGKAMTPQGWAVGTNYASLLKIYKSETENATVMLEGCKFSIVEYSLNDGKLTAGRTINDNVVTDKDGFAELNGMTGGQLYGLVETEVPDGFTLKKEPLYFIFGNSDKYPFPDEYEVMYVNNDAPIIFENDPPGEEEESTSGSTVPSEEGSTSEATKPSVTEEETTKKGDVEGEGNTTPNDPSQPETETKSPQTVTEPEGETDPDNDRNGELEGEGNLVNTSDRPYIKVILILMILSVVAAAITEITMLCSGTED